MVHQHIRRLLIAATAFLLVAAVTLVSAQEKKLNPKKLPAAVASAFKRDYPNAKITGASTEKEKGTTYYEIESKDGKTRRDLLYEADGKIAEVEETIAMDAVPAVVKATLEKEYPKAKVAKIEKVTKGDAVKYEFQIKSGKKGKEVAIDPSGVIMKPEPDEEKDEKHEKSEKED